MSSRELNYFPSTYVPIQNLHINLEVASCRIWNSFFASRVILTFKAFIVKSCVYVAISQASRDKQRRKHQPK